MTAAKILEKFAVKQAFTIAHDATVEDALRALADRHHHAAPIIDAQGIYKGMFSAHQVIRSLIPAYLVDSDVSLDFAMGLSPYLADKLREIYPTLVGDYVSIEDHSHLDADTHALEALRFLTKYGSPLPIVEKETGKLVGLISDQSAIQALLEVEANHS